MRANNRQISFLLFIMLLSAIFMNCSDQGKHHHVSFPVFASYRDIPGVTGEEIAAIAMLREQTNYFIYGMPLSTEAFENENGEVMGFSALVCKWLTELFDIPFQPVIYEWMDLLEGLYSKEISFSGELTPTLLRHEIYHMTSSIASRPVKAFRIAGSRPLWEIAETRPKRSGFITGTATIGAVTMEMQPGTFEIIEIDHFSDVYAALRSGVIDVFYYSGVAEFNFIEYPDIITQEFYPLIFMPVSLATRDPALKPVISVVDKALRNGGLRYLTTLYNQAQQEYLRFKLFKQLSEEERSYIVNNPVVLMGVDYGNYPGSFYDRREREWRGIFLDILDEVASLTGLTFERVNDEFTNWPAILQMLRDGEVSLIPELTQTSDRIGAFLWPETVQLIDYYALISNTDFPDIKINEVLHVKVGLAKDTAYTAIFRKWFPDHSDTVEFESMEEAFNALLRGEIEMVMANQKRLLYLTHYLELPNYKTNIVFDYAVNVKSGFNINEVILTSIVDKALNSIDSKSISDYWMRRTYDYRRKIAEARTPWIIGAGILSLCVLALVAAFLVKTRRAGRQLELLVGERTHELALQTATLTTLFDSIPDIIFTKNDKLQFMQCNKALLEHFGIRRENVIGKGVIDGLGLSDEMEGEYTVINEARTLVIEEHIPHINGSKPIYETIKMPLVLDGNVVGIMGIARNITGRKEMEHKVVLNYEYAKNLNYALAKITKSPTISAGILKDAADVIAEEGCNTLNAHRVGIWSYDANLNCLESISFYDDFTGINNISEKINISSRQEYISLLKSERVIVMNNVDECRLVSTPFDSYDHLCAALDAPIRIDGMLVGVVCVEQWCCDEFHDKREWIMEEQNFVSSLADLMALAISGFERRKARDSAEMANHTKSTFLANMSHEIRTPMNAILGVTEILIQKETLPADIEEGLDKIYSSCDLLLGIINDILDFSKIEAGKMDIMPARYKVASMINDSIHLNMMRINSKPIEFELNIDENIPAKLIGDEIRIKQILNNLLSNAFKYTDAGKVVLSVSSEPIPLISYLPDHSLSGRIKWMDPDNEGITLVLSVKDTGLGMTKEQQDKMFDEYSRFHQKSGKTIEGTGLGMAIAQSLLNLMNGEIHVESEPGKGSLFTVKLPQGIVDDEVLGKDVAANLQQFRMSYMINRKKGQIARDPMPYGSVLIVDDVETNLYVAVGLMKLYRLKIDTAMSGQEAIDRIKNGNVYDVIFMDHMMPEMDGIEAAKHLRDLGYTDPIIALTANAVAGQADMFLQNGFDEFISKPIDIRQLNSVLNNLIRDKQPPEVIEEARRQNIKKNSDNIFSRTDPLLVESFLRDARKAITWLEDQMQNKGFENTENRDEILKRFTIFVHGMKSSLWNIGEKEMSQTALKLELGGREQNIDLIIKDTPEFLKQLHLLLEKLESAPDNDVPAEYSEELYKKLLAIQECCADYDRKGVLDIIAEIKNCSKETKDAMEKISAHIIHSEFEEAQSAAAEYADIVYGNLPAAPSKLLAKQVDGLDISKGLECYDGDEQTYIKVLRSYASSVRYLLSDIETVSGDSLNTYKIKVHGIKGTSLDIFAEQTGKDALDLEKAAAAGDFNYVNIHNPPFLESTKKLISDIEDLLSSLDAENPKPVKDKPDAEVLAMLLSACKGYDMDDADAAIAEIEKYRYEADDGLAAWLRDNIDRMNFTQIAEKLSGMELT